MCWCAVKNLHSLTIVRYFTVRLCLHWHGLCHIATLNVNKSGTRSLAEAPRWAWLHTRGACRDVIIVSFRKFLILLNRILVSDASKQMTPDGPMWHPNIYISTSRHFWYTCAFSEYLGQGQVSRSWGQGQDHTIVCTFAGDLPLTLCD